MKNKVIWPSPVRNKLITYRNKHFSPQETYDFLSQLILEVEDLLLNPFLTKTYTEGSGEYKGISRVVINKFKIYYESQGNEVIILGIKFPGEI